MPSLLCLLMVVLWHGAAPDMEETVAGFKTNCKTCRRIATIAGKAWEWLGAIHDVNDVNDEWWWREGVTGYFEGKERPDNAFQRKQRGRIAEAGEFKYLFTVRSCKMQGFTLILASQIWRDRGVQKDGRDVCAHVTYVYGSQFWTITWQWRISVWNLGIIPNILDVQKEPWTLVYLLYGFKWSNFRTWCLNIIVFLKQTAKHQEEFAVFHWQLLCCPQDCLMWEPQSWLDSWLFAIRVGFDMVPWRTLPILDSFRSLHACNSFMFVRSLAWNWQEYLRFSQDNMCLILHNSARCWFYLPP